MPRCRRTMNEKLQEFARQAGFYANPEIEKFEKFAELIIAECCVTADANIDDSKYPSYWIKRKFGVKE